MRFWPVKLCELLELFLLPSKFLTGGALPVALADLTPLRFLFSTLPFATSIVTNLPLEDVLETPTLPVSLLRDNYYLDLVSIS
jgi:hypothetical protein